MTILLSVILLTGCEETVSTDDSGNAKTTFDISETATVNDTRIKINSVTRVDQECSWEELSISSMMSFDLKDSNGERGSYALLTESISSQLDGQVMAGDLLKGQIAYDVKDSDVFNFYYLDSLLDDQIKFVINKANIQ